MLFCREASLNSNLLNHLMKLVFYLFIHHTHQSVAHISKLASNHLRKRYAPLEQSVLQAAHLHSVGLFISAGIAQVTTKNSHTLLCFFSNLLRLPLRDYITQKKETELRGSICKMQIGGRVLVSVYEPVDTPTLMFLRRKKR